MLLFQHTEKNTGRRKGAQWESWVIALYDNVGTSMYLLYVVSLSLAASAAPVCDSHGF